MQVQGFVGSKPQVHYRKKNFLYQNIFSRTTKGFHLEIMAQKLLASRKKHQTIK
jgi:hypothetical protein